MVKAREVMIPVIESSLSLEAVLVVATLPILDVTFTGARMSTLSPKSVDRIFPPKK